jgi:hypothetical protein
MSKRRGLVLMSWLIAGAGVFFMLKDASASTMIGVLLLIWSNNVYESTRVE